MRYLLLTIITVFIFTPFSLSAEESMTVSGKILDNKGKVLSGATLMLNENIPVEVNKDTGAYQFSVEKGENYKLSASHDEYIFLHPEREFTIHGSRENENFRGFHR